MIKSSRTVYLPPEQWTYFKTAKHLRQSRGRTSKTQNIAAEAMDVPPNTKTLPPKLWMNLQSSKHGRRGRGRTSKAQNMAGEGVDIPPTTTFDL